MPTPVAHRAAPHARLSLEFPDFMLRRILLAVILAVAFAGCKTQTGLTAGATGCRVTDLDVVESRYSREGTTTAWCAKCREKIYHCVSNPQRSRVQCRLANSADPCS